MHCSLNAGCAIRVAPRFFLAFMVDGARSSGGALFGLRVLVVAIETLLKPVRGFAIQAALIACSRRCQESVQLEREAEWSGYPAGIKMLHRKPRIVMQAF